MKLVVVLPEKDVGVDGFAFPGHRDVMGMSGFKPQGTGVNRPVQILFLARLPCAEGVLTSFFVLGEVIFGAELVLTWYWRFQLHGLVGHPASASCDAFQYILDFFQRNLWSTFRTKS